MEILATDVALSRSSLGPYDLNNKSSHDPVCNLRPYSCAIRRISSKLHYGSCSYI